MFGKCVIYTSGYGPIAFAFILIPVSSKTGLQQPTHAIVVKAGFYWSPCICYHMSVFKFLMKSFKLPGILLHPAGMASKLQT